MRLSSTHNAAILLFLLGAAVSVLAKPVDNQGDWDDRIIPVDPAFVQRFASGNTTAAEDADPPALNKRTDYGFYLCSQQGFQGVCKKIMGVQDGVCRKNIMGTEASMTPDKHIRCTVYENFDCSGIGIYPFGYPGIEDFLWDIWWSAVCTHETRDPPMSYRCQYVYNDGN